jgi:hypothetical protein
MCVQQPTFFVERKGREAPAPQPAGWDARRKMLGPSATAVTSNAESNSLPLPSSSHGGADGPGNISGCRDGIELTTCIDNEQEVDSKLQATRRANKVHIEQLES